MILLMSEGRARLDGGQLVDGRAKVVVGPRRLLWRDLQRREMDGLGQSTIVMEEAGRREDGELLGFRHVWR